MTKSCFENTITARVPDWATMSINELDESIRTMKELMEKRVPEPVLVGPSVLVDAAVRSLAEQGVHGIRTIKSELLDKMQVLPEDLFELPGLRWTLEPGWDRNDIGDERRNP